MKTIQKSLFPVLLALPLVTTADAQQRESADAVTELAARWSQEIVPARDTLADELLERGRTRVIVNLALEADLAPPLESLRTDDGLAQQRDAVRRATDLVLATARAAGGDLARRMELVPVVVLDVDASTVDALVLSPAVESIEVDVQVERNDIEGALISGVNVWSAYTGGNDTFDDITGAGVSVAIVDDGIDYDHPWMGGGGFPNSKVIGGYDFADDDPDPKPTASHGTSCASLAAGPSVQLVQFHLGGIAPDAKLYALKVFRDGAEGASTSDVIASLDWAGVHQMDDPQNPIRVVNMSISAPCDTTSTAVTSGSYHSAAATLNGLGIVVVASAGNDGDPFGISQISACDNIISVGAVYDFSAPGTTFGFNTCFGQVFESPAMKAVTGYSNAGDLLDVFAPSHNAYAAQLGGSFDTDFGGTSAAAPYTAGVIALLFDYANEVGVDPTPQQIRTALQASPDALAVTDHRSGIKKPILNFEYAMRFGMPKAKVRASLAGPDMFGTDQQLEGVYLAGFEHGTSTIPFLSLTEAVQAASQDATIEIDVPSAPWSTAEILPLANSKNHTYRAIGSDLLLSQPATYTGG
ncbi:MAG: S8 family serine peptidase [Planctomycetota bacterium]